MCESPNFSDTFLSALGAWQTGWREEKQRRESRTVALLEAIAGAPHLPSLARSVEGRCFRKRFLIPNNQQNDGDFWPFFWNGEIEEGIASWSTDYNFCKTIFKPEPRPGEIACIFGRLPDPSEIVLNISALWTIPEFIKAADNFIERKGPHADGLKFKSTQSEVVLRAPLTLNDVVAFCERIPDLNDLCKEAKITTPQNEEELWQRLVKAGLLPTLPYWIEGASAQKVLNAAISQAKKRFDQVLSAAPVSGSE